MSEPRLLDGLVAVYLEKSTIQLIVVTNITYYLYDGSILVATFDEYNDVSEMFVNGPSGKIASYTGSNETSPYYYLNDHLGTPRVIMRDVESGTRQVIEYYSYHPFGEVSSSWVNLNTPYKFTSKELDEEFGFGHYYFGARYYNAKLGRFTSIDKAGQFASGFAYGSNNPIMGIDPDGNLFFLSTAFLLGAAFGGGSYAMTTDNFQFDKFLGYALFGGIAGYAGSLVEPYTAMGQSAVNSSINSLGGSIIDGSPFGVNFGAFSWSDGQGWSVANPFRGNILQSTSAMTGWMTTGKDIFKAAYHMQTSPEERAQETALRNKPGTEKNGIKYVEIDDVSEIDQVTLNRSSRLLKNTLFLAECNECFVYPLGVE